MFPRICKDFTSGTSVSTQERTHQGFYARNLNTSSRETMVVFQGYTRILKAETSVRSQGGI